MNSPFSHRGRGTIESPHNRFEKFSIEDDPGAWEEIAQTDPDFEQRRVPTEYLRDDTKSLITKNDSPDIGFTRSLNPYRGCEHGCAYCFARPYHEYLGYNSGIDFETKIMVKENAPAILDRELSRESWIPTTLACSGVTDCYQPLEKKLEITRGCLRVLADFRNPVAIITKNALVTRDLDHLASLAEENCALVVLSITTLDSQLSRVLEPRASHPRARLEAVRTLSEAGIPVGVSVAPIIPGLNDHEIPAIVQAAADHGASFASGTIVRLPYAVKDIFSNWLDQFRPERKELILNRIRELRGGELNRSEFGSRMTGEGPLAEQIQQIVRVSKQRAGLTGKRRELNTRAFRKRQMDLFDR